jgi:Cu+-exporting ATPase
MEVTACGEKSTLGKIVSMVQEAQASKPPIQLFADRVAAHFVPFSVLQSSVRSTLFFRLENVSLWLKRPPGTTAATKNLTLKRGKREEN